jgi:ankyrin repeat protein
MTSCGAACWRLLTAAMAGWRWRRPGPPSPRAALVEAVRECRTRAQVRALLAAPRVDVNAEIGRRIDPASLGRTLERRRDRRSCSLRAGADANAANQFGMTPLSRACTNGSAAMVERLLKAGANPNTAIATGETPLMTCASSGAAAAVKALLARGAAVDAAEPSQHQTALMWAAAERHSEVVAILAEAGATCAPGPGRGSPRSISRRAKATSPASRDCSTRAPT